MTTEREAELRKETFEMSNSCSCTNEDGEWLGFCAGCWESDLDYLNDLVDCDDYWHVEATGVGWRNLDGFNTFECDNAEDWIQKVVGFDCAWTFRIRSIGRDENGKAENLIAKVYHHDLPTGENRFIRRIDSDEYFELNPY